VILWRCICRDGARPLLTSAAEVIIAKRLEREAARLKIGSPDLPRAKALSNPLRDCVRENRIDQGDCCRSTEKRFDRVKGRRTTRQNRYDHLERCKLPEWVESTCKLEAPLSDSAPFCMANVAVVPDRVEMSLLAVPLEFKERERKRLIELAPPPVDGWSSWKRARRPALICAPGVESTVTLRTLEALN